MKAGDKQSSNYELFERIISFQTSLEHVDSNCSFLMVSFPCLFTLTNSQHKKVFKFLIDGNEIEHYICHTSSCYQNCTSECN